MWDGHLACAGSEAYPTNQIRLLYQLAAKTQSELEQKESNFFSSKNS